MPSPCFFWRCALGVLAHLRQQDYGLDCILFAVYLLAGMQYWRKFPQRTTGSTTAVVGLVAWAMVFPVSVALELLHPTFTFKIPFGTFQNIS